MGNTSTRNKEKVRFCYWRICHKVSPKKPSNDFIHISFLFAFPFKLYLWILSYSYQHPEGNEFFFLLVLLPSPGPKDLVSPMASLDPYSWVCFRVFPPYTNCFIYFQDYFIYSTNVHVYCIHTIHVCMLYN